ncbi:hypothetical protein MHYP_G00019240 [Metynnis hypsauchen]
MFREASDSSETLPANIRASAMATPPLTLRKVQSEVSPTCRGEAGSYHNPGSGLNSKTPAESRPLPVGYTPEQGCTGMRHHRVTA